MTRERMKEIVQIFTRWDKKNDNKDEVKAIKLEELKSANRKIGHKDKDAPYRMAIRDRIAEIENRPKRLMNVVGILTLVVCILTLAATYIK